MQVEARGHKEYGASEIGFGMLPPSCLRDGDTQFAATEEGWKPTPTKHPLETNASMPSTDPAGHGTGNASHKVQGGSLLQTV